MEEGVLRATVDPFGCPRDTRIVFTPIPSLTGPYPEAGPLRAYTGHIGSQRVAVTAAHGLLQTP